MAATAAGSCQQSAWPQRTACASRLKSLLQGRGRWQGRGGWADSQGERDAAAGPVRAAVIVGATSVAMAATAAGCVPAERPGPAHCVRIATEVAPTGPGQVAGPGRVGRFPGRARRSRWPCSGCRHCGSDFSRDGRGSGRFVPAERLAQRTACASRLKSLLQGRGRWQGRGGWADSQGERDAAAGPVRAAVIVGATSVAMAATAAGCVPAERPGPSALRAHRD